MTFNQKSKIKNQKSLASLLASCFLLLASAPLRAADDQPIPPQVQSAVDRGLDFLAKEQQDNGSWRTATGGGANTGPTAAVTSLAALAFMARGNVPGQGPYGDHLNRAVDYILSIQQKNGLLCAHDGFPTMYDHGISTVMLCETYGMLDDKRQALAKTAISRAVRLIIDAQKIPKSNDFQGGWRYAPNSPDSDLSVTGWQLMALRGAANIGAAVPPSSIDAGIAYVKKCANPSGGFAYTGSDNVNAALTGTGILALELLGQHNARQALAGGDYLLQQPITTGSDSPFYFYTVYYCSQAAWQLGDRYWDAINPIIRKSLLDHQSPNGSWPVPNGDPEHQGGTALGTSMAILALTVPYRYLPLYQR
jgi:prenyltransferase beta subunit